MIANKKLFTICCLLLLAFVPNAISKSAYDADWNQKRIKEISKEILRQVTVQEEEYQKKQEEFNGKGQGGYGDWRDGGHGMSPRYGEEGQPEKEELEPYVLDVPRIKDVIQKRFGGKIEESFGKYPQVDIRDDIALREAAAAIVLKKPEFVDYKPAEIDQLIQDVDKKYPLYREGQNVTVTINGKEYTGKYRNEGKFLFTIGDTKFKKADVSKDVLAFFDPALNMEARIAALSVNGILAQELANIDKKYPLYKEGQTVEITFAHGNEPRKTYKGAFRFAGVNKIMIGKSHLTKEDLPEVIMASFYPDVNAMCRQREFARHPVMSEMKLKIDDDIAAEVKRMRAEQFEKNLPRGWVFINNTWKLPVDLVEDTLEYRLNQIKVRQEGARGAGGVTIVPGVSN